MKINNDTFVYTVYMYCHIFANKLFNNVTWNKHSDEIRPIPTNTNLCQFMRSVLIWTPLYFLIVAALIGGYGYAIFYLPFLYGGAVGYFNVYGVPLIIIGCIVGFVMVMGIIYGDDEKKEAKKKAKEEAKLKRHEIGNYTMWEIFVKYYKSTKEKVCPLIEIKQNGENK